MAKMRECPECGISVKLENLETHIKRVHPRADVKALLSEDDKTEIMIEKKKKKKTGKPFEKQERKRWAIAGVIVAVIVLVVIFAVAVLPPPGNDSIVDKPAPDIDAQDVDNQHFILNNHIGPRLILLEFFYTECSWCIEMHPNLEQLHAFYGWGDQVEIVSISADSRDTFEDVRSFRDLHGSNWTFISAPESLADTYQVTGTPTMYLVDTNGIVREKIYGYKSVEAMKDIIDEYL